MNADACEANEVSAVSGWVDICDLDDILVGTGMAALVGDRQMAVFRLRDDRVFAIGNHDPFSDAPVLSRGIVGDLDGELVVASPIYKQHFRLADGVCVEDEAVNVGAFEADVVDGRVRVNAGAA